MRAGIPPGNVNLQIDVPVNMDNFRGVDCNDIMTGMLPGGHARNPEITYNPGTHDVSRWIYPPVAAMGGCDLRFSEIPPGRRLLFPVLPVGRWRECG